MGYDTVLLLVDESVFGACDRYLARAPSHDDTVQEIATLLATDRHAGELARAEWLFVQASVKAPGLKARNVALSLWREEEMGVVFPRAWSCPLEQHLPLAPQFAPVAEFSVEESWERLCASSANDRDGFAA